VGLVITTVFTSSLWAPFQFVLSISSGGFCGEGSRACSRLEPGLDVYEKIIGFFL
jgi:hypothetical protein